jgi:hypothetical protein
MGGGAAGAIAGMNMPSPERDYKFVSKATSGETVTFRVTGTRNDPDAALRKAKSIAPNAQFARPYKSWGSSGMLELCGILAMIITSIITLYGLMQFQSDNKKYEKYEECAKVHSAGGTFPSFCASTWTSGE